MYVDKVVSFTGFSCLFAMSSLPSQKQDEILTQYIQVQWWNLITILYLYLSGSDRVTSISVNINILKNSKSYRKHAKRGGGGVKYAAQTV